MARLAAIQQEETEKTEQRKLNLCFLSCLLYENLLKTRRLSRIEARITRMGEYEKAFQQTPFPIRVIRG